MKVFSFIVTTSLLIYIIFNQKKILMEQTEAAQKLRDISAQLQKANDELQTAIQKLTDAVANADDVSPDLQSAIDEVTAKAQALDDITPDNPQ